LLFAVSIILQQIKNREAKLENEYSRVVSWEGNVKAQKLMSETFDVVDGSWRGLGRIPDSALALKAEYRGYDARRKYNVKVEQSRDLLPGCHCHLVMIGKIRPPECSLYMKACTPQTPKGACMVSVEGTCRIWARTQRKT